MSYKGIFLVIVILFLSLFIFLKYEAMGAPDSAFNQTTRFTFGKYPWVRTILGLHNPGDARAELLENSGPLAIVWFSPSTEDVDDSLIKNFAALAGKYTGRQPQIFYGGQISQGTVDLQGLENLGFRGTALEPNATILYVVFTTDYLPRDTGELSTTHGEKTIVISLDSHREFLGSYINDLNNYLLSSLLHEFGHEIGLAHNTDTNCIMSEHAGTNGVPMEGFGTAVPLDFCSVEIDQINSIKAKLQ